MNPAHLHLIVNHIPVIGSGIALLLLFVAIVRRDPGLARAGLLVVLVTAVGAALALASGDNAEDLVEQLDGVSRPAIHEHEERAEATIWVAAIAGAAALAALIAAGRGASQVLRDTLTLVASACTVLAFLAMVWTADAGRRIRHAEITMRPADAAAVSGDGDTEP